MQIESIQLFHISFHEANSESGASLESVLVKMRSRDKVGWGEVTLGVGPSDDAEWAAGAFICLRDWLVPALVGRAIDSGQQLQQALQSFHGNARAKSALDIAWWSLAAREQNKPLHQLLGASRTAIPLGCTLGVMDMSERLFAEIGAAFELGYGCVTLKVRPGWDVQMLRAVRQAFPSQALAVDCDGLGTLDQQEMFYQMEDFFLESIEQPLAADDLVGHAMLQSSIRTPVCLDQSITSAARVEQAIDLASCRMVRVDIARVGGLTPALEIRDICRRAKIPVGVGGRPGSEVAGSAAAALAASCDLPPWPQEACDWQPKRWLVPDATTQRKINADGQCEIEFSSEVLPRGLEVHTHILEAAAIQMCSQAQFNRPAEWRIL